jgi:hypothetical protein
VKSKTAITFGGLFLAIAVITPAAAQDKPRYVAPITSAVFNETPQITTEIRPLYWYNWIPGDFVTGGGYISMVAVQLRAALTENLGFIATKDGYADVNFDSVLPDESGWANIAAGLKYALINDHEEGKYLTLGGRYEAPSGDLETAGIDLQGSGDGLIDVFATGSRMLGESTGFQASAGLTIALDGGHDSSLFHASAHLDQELFSGFYGVIETNIVTTVSDGSRTDSSAVGSFEGFDLVNFGSTDSGTVATFGFGARYRLTDYLHFGAAYEVPMTGREDIIDRRVTVDMIIVL